ncbi:Kelch motif family protein [Tritrichomonas foetus]|uniref:Kelch motif family protein n=1 Tax=Tritrichomonas foetus TaxID=1144522 RepID=A0A1J4KJD7_9EUKA|nr:Kelch motif family protein [Tritrichomonas foetus]|eukprot:OHT11056.1 Kelch motif family protein [Tritrichomonas foetus]
MGNSESEAGSTYIRPTDNYSYQLATETHFVHPTSTASFQLPEKNQNQILLKSAYHGVWSMTYPHGVPPEPRVGQCHVFDSQRDELIIAYGSDASGKCLNDAWILNLKTFNWRNLSRGLLSPRQYPSATLVGRKMYIFGGASNLDFFGDLHCVDIDTGVLTVIQTTGQAPSPRTSPVIFYFDNSIFIWSGFDGNTDGDLYMVPATGGEWRVVKQEMTDRAAPAFCHFGDDLYVFGSSKGNGLLSFNRKTLQFDIVNCTGPAPLPELTHPSLVAADEYLFVIGGEATLRYMYLFALDVRRRWWFAFHVRPDNNSVILTDGIVSKIGLFMMPREHSVAVAYSRSEKELISVMGSRLLNPTPVFKIAIGEALGVLHLRSDMYDMFQRDMAQQ